jgi:hypothetical protein
MLRPSSANFLERLIGYTCWPWGQASPVRRDKRPSRTAALVSSSSMPGFCIPLLTGTAQALAISAKLLGARPVGKLWIGLKGQQPHQPLSERTLAHARRIVIRLV